MAVTAPGQISLSTASKRSTIQSIREWLNTLSDPDTGVIGSPYVNLIRDSANAVDLQPKLVEIGDWNMVADSSVDVAHGLTLAKIRSVEGLIRNDADTGYSPIPSGGGNDVFFNAATPTDATNVRLNRLGAGAFDSTSYNATSYNRGWLLIWHTP